MDITLNDLFLIITWTVGIGGALISVYFSRKGIKEAARVMLERAAFENAQLALKLVRDQVAFLEKELLKVRNLLEDLRDKNDVLWTRTQLLERALMLGGIKIPEDEE